jgi:DNA-binding NarL/FixJ family response regulator
MLRSVVDALQSSLTRAHRAAAAGDWADALDGFLRADEVDPGLGPQDLEAMGRAAYMRGLDQTYSDALERAYRAHRRDGAVAAAARCTWWLGHSFLFRGDAVRAEGWFAVGRRLLDEAALDCVERGYLMAPAWLQQMAAGDWAAGLQTARRAERVGDRFAEPDLVWLARDDQARALLNLGRVADALRLVDELLVVVDSGTLSPLVSGIVYCNTIVFCRDALALRHTRQWVDGLSRWCDQQPQMVAHNGLCLAHRAEVQQLEGDWSGALETAARAAERFRAGALNEIAVGRAHYREGEIHRLQGRLDDAERSFREASRCGHEPQPGLALLRLAQDRGDDAAASIRRAVTEHVDPLQRSALLPAYVDVMVAQGELGAAESATTELTGLADRFDSEALRAEAHHAGAQVLLARGAAHPALVEARQAWRIWHDLGAVYEAARARAQVARACAELGDRDAAQLEESAARETLHRLGAAVRTTASSPAGPWRAGSSPGDPGALSPREVEVLQKVGEGLGNREVARALVISEHTVARHLQNIYVKLDVASRTAAVARGRALGLL